MTRWLQRSEGDKLRGRDDESTATPSAGVGWMTQGGLGWGVRTGPDMGLEGLGGWRVAMAVYYCTMTKECKRTQEVEAPGTREAAV